MSSPPLNQDQLEKRLDEVVRELDDLRSRHSHLKQTVISLERSLKYVRWGFMLICALVLIQTARAFLVVVERSFLLIFIILGLVIFWFFLPSFLKRKK